MILCCPSCGWEYDRALGLPDEGIFHDSPLPDGFVCPVCGTEKEKFLPQK